MISGPQGHETQLCRQTCHMSYVRSHVYITEPASQAGYLVLLLLLSHLLAKSSPPWSQDRLQTRWSGGIPQEKKHKQTKKSGTRSLDYCRPISWLVYRSLTHALNIFETYQILLGIRTAVDEFLSFTRKWPSSGTDIS